ncbi:aldo/keto reductase [Alicyclobacillus fastidiosus]|uniref:Aldo/keto reductase n=1 Tax=Alicyclobacillus fastidiosus TaxID=392011 RepID=A0ABV5AD82_9BACL|nr:aldo/keto reductase [Alicyclobacillus fastidiosus]WEH08816.1 aldo/keto reductase [Alicyclobacillus fastidiosus]
MTAKHLADTTTLNNGVQMPWFGLGVWQTKEGDEVEQAVTYALSAGYRHIDTAAAYKNEQGVGNAIRKSGIAREDLFVTTKLWNADQGYDTALRAFEESNRRLGLEYVDLYLIHWPVKGKYKDSWKALEKLYKDGVVRAIGVSNFHIHHLEDLLADAEVVPAVNQVECHPLLAQTKLRSFCADHKIQFEAWSPLMQGNLDHGALVDIAKKYNKTPAQVVLRWDLQHDIVTIPKSIREARIVENAQVFDFELSSEDMAAIDGLNENRRFGADPDNFNF